MNQANHKQNWFSAGALALALSFPTTILASPIFPGFDLFSTGDGAIVDLTGFGLGVVDLEGNLSR